MEESHEVWKPKVLVLGPGGVKGLLEVGALRYLEQTGMLDEVEIYAGCSIGSVISLLKICGYEAQDMMIEGSNISIFDNLDLDFTKMSSDAGIVSMSVMGNRIEGLVKMKMGKVPTLYELYMATNKSLFCTAFNMTRKRTEHLSKESHPNLSCVKACMMSCAVPVLFQKVEYHGCRYIDGAVGNPYPINMFDDSKTDILGIYIQTMSKVRNSTLSELIDVAETIIGIEQKRTTIIQSSSTRCKHLRLQCSVLDTTGVSLGIPAKADLMIDGWNAAKSMFPSKVTPNGLELKPIPHLVDSTSLSTIQGGKIIVRITKSTKLAIERMGIEIDRYEESDTDQEDIKGSFDSLESKPEVTNINSKDNEG